MMRVISVNVGLPRTLSYQGKSVTTGIFKTPVKGRVQVRKLNLDGDRQADPTVHGGPDKAVYSYPVEHYDAWARELGRKDLAPAQFGENLTVEGMLEETVHIGDVFRIGSTLLEVAQPRVPCYKLGLKMRSTRFPKQFLASGRSGYYLRVLEEGEVGAGDEIRGVGVGADRLSIKQLVRLAMSSEPDHDLVQRALANPALSLEWRHVLGAASAHGG